MLQFSSSHALKDNAVDLQKREAGKMKGGGLLPNSLPLQTLFIFQDGDGARDFLIQLFSSSSSSPSVISSSLPPSHLPPHLLLSLLLRPLTLLLLLLLFFFHFIFFLSSSSSSFPCRSNLLASHSGFLLLSHHLGTFQSRTGGTCC